MRMMQVFLLGLGVAACSDSGDDGDALDTLPKRGERDTDPTVVSVAASCTGDLMFKGLVVRISASDPTPSNLGSCAATYGTITHQGSFSASSACDVTLGPDCTLGTEYVVDLTVANKTGGVTTATVKVRP